MKFELQIEKRYRSFSMDKGQDEQKSTDGFKEWKRLVTLKTIYNSRGKERKQVLTRLLLQILLNDRKIKLEDLASLIK